ncbi:MAG TPA: hypothetical protein VEB20_04255 [Azospirillaceae bacterium]|nr:hypothetical protein [Azospirillaceae bacterium]
MKRLTAIAVVVLGVGAAGVARADCALGDPPAVPEGASATEAQMTETSGAVKKFMAETQEYLSCLEFEGKGKPGGAWTKKYNDAVEQMEKLASDFNKQLRAFKSK